MTHVRVEVERNTNSAMGAELNVVGFGARFFRVPGN